MRRSIGQCEPVHRRAGLGTAVGLLVVALVMVGCGGAPVTPAAPTTSSSAAPAPPSPTADATSTRPTAISPTPSTVNSPGSSPPATTTTAPTADSSKPHTSSTLPTRTSVAPPPPRTTPPTTTRTATPTTPSPGVPRLVELWAGQDIEAVDTGRKVVALTFDGGASADAVDSILATLADYDVPATFFVTGSFARNYPRSVTAMSKAGHPVGNHSNTHPYFTQTTNDEIRAELAAAERAISALTGATTKPLFRFPYGDRAALDIRVVNGAGYIPIRWTVDTLGWKGTSEGITTAIIRQRILDGLRPGQIVLMHVGAHPDDHSTLDAAALPGIIEDLRARGYSFTTIPDLLDDAL